MSKERIAKTLDLTILSAVLAALEDMGRNESDHRGAFVVAGLRIAKLIVDSDGEIEPAEAVRQVTREVSTGELGRGPKAAAS